MEQAPFRYLSSNLRLELLCGGIFLLHKVFASSEAAML